MNEELKKWFSFLLELEGPASNDPDDAGGFTEYGLSERFLKSHGLARPRSAEDAFPIYAKYFFYDHKLDRLPAPIACYLFLMGVLVGPAFAIRLLQRAVGAAVDGKIGPETIRLLQRRGVRFALELTAAHMCNHLLNVSTYRWGTNKKYLIGWLRRNLIVFDYAVNEKWKQFGPS